MFSSNIYHRQPNVILLSQPILALINRTGGLYGRIWIEAMSTGRSHLVAFKFWPYIYSRVSMPSLAGVLISCLN